MTRECSCGETFETLTSLRIHQRDECPDREEEIDVDDEDLDTIGEMVYDELTICDVCGADVEGVDGIEQGTTDGSVTITVTFDCPDCGGFNENTAFLS